MLRRQSRDTNKNIKKVGVLPIWKVKSNVLSVGPSSERNVKRSVLRRQCSDTNKNIKKVGVLPIWKVKSNVSSVMQALKN